MSKDLYIDWNQLVWAHLGFTYDVEGINGRVTNRGTSPPRLPYQKTREGAQRGQSAWASACQTGFNYEATRGTPGYKLKDAALAALEDFRERRTARAAVCESGGVADVDGVGRTPQQADAPEETLG